MNRLNTLAACAAKPAFVAFLLAGTVIGAAPAYAAGTEAGTQIQNTATATYDLAGGGEGTVDSNTVTLTVDELLDVAVTWADPADVDVSAGDTDEVLRFTLTNAGNGTEAFTLSTSATGGDFDPTGVSIYLDSNSNGVYDPMTDAAYVPGGNDPSLGSDDTVSVFVLSDIPGTAADTQRGRIRLTAEANTGIGAAGTTFAGQGQGGGNAVVGTTTADDFDDGYYLVSAAPPPPPDPATVALVKSAAVTDPFGGTTQVPGSTITYTLEATVSGSGSLANLRVGDEIPTGTTYKTGTITLDGVALTDAVDADQGSYSGTAIAVSLGTVAAGTTHDVTFQVEIDDN